MRKFSLAAGISRGIIRERCKELQKDIKSCIIARMNYFEIQAFTPNVSSIPHENLNSNFRQKKKKDRKSSQ